MPVAASRSSPNGTGFLLTDLEFIALYANDAAGSILFFPENCRVMQSSASVRRHAFVPSSTPTTLLAWVAARVVAPNGQPTILKHQDIFYTVLN